MFRTLRGKQLATYAAVAFALLLVVTGAVWWVFEHNGTKRITAFGTMRSACVMIRSAARASQRSPKRAPRC